MTGLPVHDGQWQGGECYLIGGGPSLRSFDWNALRGKERVIVVNRAFKDCPWAAIWWSEDASVITEVWGRSDEWRAFRGVKLLSADPAFEPSVHAVDPSVHFVWPKRKGKFWSKSLAEGFAWASNSLVGALNLADVFGADPIYILGLDCNQVGGMETNYHGDYEAVRRDRTGDFQYASYKSDFENWAAPNLRHRRVVNLNVASAVECWPRVSWQSRLTASDPML